MKDKNMKYLYFLIFTLILASCSIESPDISNQHANKSVETEAIVGYIPPITQCVEGGINYSCIFIVAEYESVDVCEKVYNESDFPDYFSDHTFCVQAFAMHEKDPSLCEGLEGESVFACFKGYASNLKDPSVCDMIRDTTDQPYLMTRANYYKEKCIIYSSDDIHRCDGLEGREDCVEKTAVDTGNISLCKELGDPRYCLTILLEKVSDPKDCNHLPNVDVPHNYGLITISVKDKCYYKIGKKRDDLVICDLISDDYAKYDCYYMVKWGTGNDSICDMIPEGVGQVVGRTKGDMKECCVKGC